MTRTIIIGVTGICIAAVMLALGLSAGIGSRSLASPEPAVVAAPDMSGQDREAIETIVRNYLLDNPEIMLEVQAALENRQREQQRLAQSEAINGYTDAIFLSPTDGIIGNPEGSVTIVEFFDYNCGYCKRALDDMDAMLAADPDLRFVLKEFPILGPDSQKAHVVSMAFRSLHPDKYADFHRSLLGGSGRADEQKAMDIALELGADEAALREAMGNPEINEAFALTYDLANALSITGTPSYVIGDEVVFGALGEATLTAKVANVRECRSTECS